MLFVMLDNIEDFGEDQMHCYKRIIAFINLLLDAKLFVSGTYNNAAYFHSSCKSQTWSRRSGSNVCRHSWSTVLRTTTICRAC